MADSQPVAIVRYSSRASSNERSIGAHQAAPLRLKSNRLSGLRRRNCLTRRPPFRHIYVHVHVLISARARSHLRRGLGGCAVRLAPEFSSKCRATRNGVCRLRDSSIYLPTEAEYRRYRRLLGSIPILQYDSARIRDLYFRVSAVSAEKATIRINTTRDEHNDQREDQFALTL